jgi:hypothetical protein
VNIPDPVGQTRLQRAIELTIGAYRASARMLSPAERDVLRDVLAARLAADYLTELGVLGEREREQAA